MIGNSGLFRNVSCPLGNDCDRPYCHFQHSTGILQKPLIDLGICDFQSLTDYSGTTVLDTLTNNQSSSNVAQKNFIISQEEPYIENCYVGYVGSVETSAEGANVLPSTNLYGQSFDYSDTSQNQALYAPTNFLCNTGQNSMFSNLQLQQSLYAPEDPVFSSFYQSTSGTSSNLPYQSYIPSYQQVSDTESCFLKTQETANQYQQQVKQFFTTKDHYVSNQSYKNISENCRKRENVLPIDNSVVPPKRFNMNVHNLHTKSQKKTSKISVYVPTPIAELERQKNNEKKLQEEKKQLRLKEIQEKERVRAVPRDRSPAADEFSIIDRPKLPIDLADDEILNPSKRALISKKESNEFKNLKVDALTNKSIDKKIVSQKIRKKVGVCSFNKEQILVSNKKDNNKLINSEHNSVYGSKKKTEEELKNKKLDKGEISNKNSSDILIKRKIFDKIGQVSNTDVSINKLNKNLTDFENYKKKQDRLGQLNATARAIAEIDQQIAEKERALRELINDSKSLKVELKKNEELSLKKPINTFVKKRNDDILSKEKKVIVKKKIEEINSDESNNNEFDIDSLFEDNDDQTSTTLQQNLKTNKIEEDNDDCLIFHSSVTKKKSIETSKTPNLTPATKTPNLTLASKVNIPIASGKRQARPNAVVRSLKLKQDLVKKPKILSAVEQLKNRYAVLTANSTSNNEKNSLKSSFSKEDGTKTRVASTMSNFSNNNLAPLDMHNSKITYSFRVKYLNNIYVEIKKTTKNDDDAKQKATLEEKAIIDRISTKQAYVVAVANAIRRIRTAAENHSLENINCSNQNVLSKKQTSLGINHAKKVNLKLENITELEFYNILSEKYLLTKEKLEENMYPIWIDINKKDQVKLGRNDETKQTDLKRGYVDDNETARICCRCGLKYFLSKDGDYLARDTTCIFHYGKAWKKRVNGTYDSRYTCCEQDLNNKGCVIGAFHCTETQRRQTLFDFIETPLPNGLNDSRSHKVYALDCEMVYGVWGPMLARISLVNILDELVFDTIVKPEYKVIDPNTRFSGLTLEQLESAKCTFNESRQRLFEFINSETIIIGHSLESDLKSLHIVHNKVVDTSVIFPHRMGPPMKRALKTITFEVLQKIIQEDVTGHDSKEDASACMQIMLYKIKKLDRNHNNNDDISGAIVDCDQNFNT